MTDNLKRGRQSLEAAHGCGCDETMWPFLTPAIEEHRIILLGNAAG